MTKTQAACTEPYTPWKDRYRYGPGEDFYNWLQWASDGFSGVYHMKASEVLDMYQKMKELAIECHKNHPAIEADIGE